MRREHGLEPFYGGGGGGGGGGRRNEDFWANFFHDRISRRDQSVWERFKILEFLLHFGTAHNFPITQYLHEFERKINEKHVCYELRICKVLTCSYFWSAICNLSYTFKHVPVS